MKADLPLVSVIIPAYNAEVFIGQTLESVLSQSYKNIEVVVVDDGSQDRTAEIVESFAQKDSRIFLYKQVNAGVAAARNLAIEKSSGEYIAPLDADDIWYEQKLEKQVQAFLESDQSVGLVYVWSVFINEEDEILGKYTPEDYLTVCKVEGEVYPALVYANFIGSASVPLIRRICFEQLGGYNVKLKDMNAQGCEDWDIYLRIAEFYQFKVVPEFLIAYRQVIGSMSTGFTTMARSYNIVMADAQQRRPKIPTYIYNWSAGSFYFYLSKKSRVNGDYYSTIVWLYRAIKLDYTPLLTLTVYKGILECLLKIAAKPVTSLIWPDHHSWMQFQNKFSSHNGDANQVNTVSEIQNRIYQPQQLPWKPYTRIMWQRWLLVLQLCRTVSY